MVEPAVGWSEGVRCLLLALLSMVAASAESADENGGTGRGGLDVGAVLGDVADQGFARADRPRRFVFPDDHGPHPAFRSEWWYVTVDLADAAGAPVGVQFTLFRQALAPPTSPRETDSSWRASAVWMAHVAVTTGDGHHAAERFARGDGLGLAGARSAPLSVWLEDWRLEEVAPQAGEADSSLVLRLTARTGAASAQPFEVDLRLVARRPPVLQGEAGLSRKSAREGNASYYYSMPRMQARGSVHVGDARHAVSGLGWLDREWSTSALDAGQIGWDWFALHLEDGRDLMLYQLRRDDGRIDDASAGTLVAADGGVRRLAVGDYTLEALEFWTDEDGGRWPVVWQLSVPDAGIDGRVVARRRDALNRLTVRYWEGPVRLEGAQGSPAGGGYLELTGYGQGEQRR